MKRILFCAVRFLWLAAGFLLLGFTSSDAAAADAKFETQLIWGTNASKSPDARHKPVEPEIRKRLDRLPLKWANYFEVKREQFRVAGTGSKKVTLDQCAIEVKDLDGKNVEVSFAGKGKPILTRTQSLPKGEVLVVGGDAPDSTTWLVTLKRIE